MNAYPTTPIWEKLAQIPLAILFIVCILVAGVIFSVVYILVLLPMLFVAKCFGYRGGSFIPHICPP